jgi:SAM-dependent methyltransferase
LRYLRHLPEVDAGDCIPDFESSRVTVQHCPAGPWSTPLIDTVVLVKGAIGFRCRRILEIGSYLGYTAKLLAENTGPEVRVTTLDEHPEHGSAYRGTALETKIDRRVGKISLDHFSQGEKYDLIFVDADHRFDAVVNDTEVALALLSDGGVIVWHDYQHTNHFQGYNDVPEALRLFSEQIPIVAITGTWLAIHSRHPGWETAKRLRPTVTQGSMDAWKAKSVRG